MVVALLSVPTFAAGFQVDRPVLMTSVGQSSDIAMVNVLFNNRLGLDFAVEEQVTADGLENVKTLVLVVGASAKGLGAAGLDADQEEARVQSLIEYARANDIGILALHTGGAARRGRLSDAFVEQAVRAADYTIVVETGNEDGFFDTLTDESGGTLVEIERIVDVGDEMMKVLAD